MELAGIKYIKDAAGRKRYVRIDLDMYEGNEALQDFLDLLEIEVCKGDETVSLDEFNKYIDGRLKANVPDYCP